MGANIKGLILCIAITAAIALWGLSSISEPIAAEDISSVSQSGEKYILGEFEGKLAIYEKYGNFPVEVLDVRLDSLPERDIEKIKKGISANSLSEIISLAEDYE